MIELIERMEKNGFAYVLEDGVYFDTSKLPDYGAMANLQNMEIKEGARIGVHAGKRNPTDFALWIKAEGENANHVMHWPSPWGVGFPGWHIECSAMSMKYLGEHFDIHCGGIDHVPVHHTNEIAQNEAAAGHKTVNYWLHGEFLNIDEKRMGKSQGNFITLQTLVDKKLDPMAYRYLLLQTHYRQKMNFSFEAVVAAQNGLQNMLDALSSFGAEEGSVSQEYQVRFNAAIDDDLNIPQALGIAWELIKDTSLSSADKCTTLFKFDSVFGLNLKASASVEIPARIQQLVKERLLAREQKNWAESDRLRLEIEAAGFLVEDTASGSNVRIKR
jgi:cysteinyl-tRNA synthetase